MCSRPLRRSREPIGFRPGKRRVRLSTATREGSDDRRRVAGRVRWIFFRPALGGQRQGLAVVAEQRVLGVRAVRALDLDRVLHRLADRPLARCWFAIEEHIRH